MDMFRFIDRDTMEGLYSKMSTFTPFEDKEDKRVDRRGVNLRDKEYYICGTEMTTEKYVYTQVDDDVYEQIGVIDYTKEKHNNKPCMKIWFLQVADAYQRLGLASMLIASVKNECQVQGISTIILDAAKRYKVKDARYRENYPNEPDDGSSFYNANLLYYEHMGFKIDGEESKYKKPMERYITDTSPIPMICELDGIVQPESAKKCIFGKKSKAPAPTQDDGPCQ